MKFQPQARPMDDEKLRELILYVCDRMESDANFGDVKLNKVLFYSDFTAYLRLGKSITGHRYKKQIYGPVLHAMLPFREKMIARKDCVLKTRKVLGGYTQQRTVALREPELSVFTPDEIALVDEMIERIRPLSAREISDISHDFFGWRVVDMGEEIPYEMVFLVQRELTAGERKRALQLEPTVGQ